MPRLFLYLLAVVTVLVPLSASAQFDIEHEPINYLIYSAAFDGLPAELKEIVYRKLHDVLTGKDQSPTYKHLSNEDRQAILEILLDTKRDVPASWLVPAKREP